jgi:hypothetical protein
LYLHGQASSRRVTIRPQPWHAGGSCSTWTRMRMKRRRRRRRKKMERPQAVMQVS